MNKNWLRYGAAICAVVVVALIVLNLLSRPKNYQVVASAKMAQNIASPALIDNQLYYFSGSVFASLDPQTSRSTALSYQDAFPIISTIRWSKEGALFKATNFEANDALYSQLVSRELSLDRAYWWYLDFHSKQIRLLDEEGPVHQVVDAIWTSEATYAVISKSTLSDGDDGGSSNELSSRSSDGRLIATHAYSATKELRIAGGSKDQLFILQGDSLLVFNTLTGSNSSLKLPKNTKLATASQDGKQLLLQVQNEDQAESTESSPFSLVAYTVGSQKTKKIAGKFSGQVLWDEQNSVFVFTGASRANEFMGSYDPVNKKTTTLSFEDSADQTTYSWLFILRNEQKKPIYIATDSLHDLYLMGSTQPAVKPVPDIPATLLSTKTTPQYRVKYDDDTRSFDVIILQNPYRTSQDAALQYLSSVGLDTNQASLRWRKAMEVN